MPEDMNLEVAHRLTEREHPVSESRRWEEVIEILGVLLLAVAAVATAWGGFQAAKGDGRQSICTPKRAWTGSRPPPSPSPVSNELASDAATFNEWLQAERANDAQLQAMLVRRFSPEYRTAFVAWLKTAPFTTPSAPPGPAYLPEYHNPQLEQATHLNEEAAVAEEEGTHARETAEKYIGATVLFALVLFLVAVSQRFRILGVRRPRLTRTASPNSTRVRVASARWRTNWVTVSASTRPTSWLPASRPRVTKTMAWLIGVDRSRPDTAP